MLVQLTENQGAGRVRLYRVNGYGTIYLPRTADVYWCHVSDGSARLFGFGLRYEAKSWDGDPLFEVRLHEPE